MKKLLLTVAAIVLMAQMAFADATITGVPSVRQLPGHVTGMMTVFTNGSAVVATLTLPDSTVVVGTGFPSGNNTAFIFLSANNSVVNGSTVFFDVTDGTNLDSRAVPCYIGAGGFITCR